MPQAWRFMKSATGSYARPDKLCIPQTAFSFLTAGIIMMSMNYTIEQSPLAHLFFSSRKSAPLWFLVRIYVGYEWILAGWGKVTNPAWFGSGAGAALNGFVQGALHKTAYYCAPAPAVCHADVAGWYASFLQSAVLPHLVIWSNAVAVGEILVGLGLIVGVVTGIAAFFGFFMNLNFLMAGTVSINPQLLILGLGIMLAWRVAGDFGGDRYVLPWLRRHCRSHRHS